MNKTPIKIIKRQAQDETTSDSKAADASLKAARSVNREMIKTINGWVDEQRQQNRLAELVAHREPFGKAI